VSEEAKKAIKCDICGKYVNRIIETWSIGNMDEVDCCEKCDDKLKELEGGK